MGKKVDETKKRIEARVFKIKQEREAKAKTVKDDLRAAAKNSTHKRNRAPDDGFQLVGDRRRNVCKVADLEESSSNEEQDLNISEMCSIAKKNAYEIHKQQEKREQKEAKRAAKEMKVNEQQIAAKKAEKRERRKQMVEEEQKLQEIDAFNLKF